MGKNKKLLSWYSTDQHLCNRVLHQHISRAHICYTLEYYQNEINSDTSQGSLAPYKPMFGLGKAARTCLMSCYLCCRMGRKVFIVFSSRLDDMTLPTFIMHTWVHQVKDLRRCKTLLLALFPILKVVRRKWQGAKLPIRAPWEDSKLFQ